jgi:iron complex transport system substrate-binding protein
LHGRQVSERIDEITANAAAQENSPTVLLVRAGAGRVTVRGSDTMVGAMLSDMNTVNIANIEESLLDDLSMEIIIRENPDFIFATTMGNEETSLQLLTDILENNPAWSGLSAVQNDRYMVLSKELFHLQPNNRWAESYEFLWALMYEQT